MARPKKKIDEDQVLKLVSINCSVSEMADFFNIGERTIRRRFGRVLKEGRGQGKMSLKRRMWETAMSNNKGAVTMQIWLSKQMLGYTDKVEQKADFKTTQVVEIQWADENDDTQNAKTNSTAEEDLTIN